MTSRRVRIVLLSMLALALTVVLVPAVRRYGHARGYARAAMRGPAASAASRGNGRLHAASSRSVPRPPIVWDPIPFGAARKRQTAEYVARHYHSFMRPTYLLKQPKVIVIHYTEGPSFISAFNAFAPDVPDPELHELPGTCAHFVIDRSGTIHQLVSLAYICRHTVGLNWTAIGVEHVGFSDWEIMDDHRQITASLHLVHWLRCRYGIPIKDVIGHNESLSSPYHHEDVWALRNQTHSDFGHADMNVYRRWLARLGGCPQR